MQIRLIYNRSRHSFIVLNIADISLEIEEERERDIFAVRLFEHNFMVSQFAIFIENLL